MTLAAKTPMLPCVSNRACGEDTAFTSFSIVAKTPPLPHGPPESRPNTKVLRERYPCATLVQPGSAEQAECNMHWMEAWGPTDQEVAAAAAAAATAAAAEEEDGEEASSTLT